MIKAHLLADSNDLRQVLPDGWFSTTQFYRICPASIQHDLIHPFNAIQGRLVDRSFVAIGKTNRTMQVTPVGSHNGCGRGVLLMVRANTTVVGATPIMPGQPLLGTFRNSITTKISPFKIMFSVIPPDDKDRKSTRLNSSHSQISYAVF